MNTAMGHQNAVGERDRSSMLKEMRDKRKEKKAEEDDGEADLADTLAEERRKYEEIMSRIDMIKGKTHNDGDQEGEMNIAIQGLKDQQRINTSSRAEIS